MTNGLAETNIFKGLAASACNAGFDVQFSAATLRSRRADIKLPYVMVAVDMMRGETSLEEISAIARLISQYFVNEKMTDTYGGLEILYRSIRGRLIIRFARISILPDGIEKAKSILADDLRLNKKYSGIATMIYQKKLMDT